MKSRITAISILLGSVLATGCYPDPTILDLRFPTETHFIYGDNAKVLMFELEQGEINPCPALTRQVVDGIGNREAAQEYSVPMCSLLDGGLEFSEVGLGNRAFIAAIEDDAGDIILSGCTVGATFVDAPQISLMLSPTDNFEDTIDRLGDLGCTTIQEKCQQGC